MPISSPRSRCDSGNHNQMFVRIPVDYVCLFVHVLCSVNLVICPVRLLVHSSCSVNLVSCLPT